MQDITVTELIKQLSKLNPNAKLVIVTNPENPEFHEVGVACYFQGLSNFSDHFDPDALSSDGVVYLTGIRVAEE